MNHIDIDMHRALSELDDPRRGIALKRNTAADLVTALIDFLDLTEGDCDLEDNGDLEPSLGGGEVVLLGEVDLELDDSDREPALGSPEITSRHRSAGMWWWDQVGDQTTWSQGRGDVEEETAEAEDAGGGNVVDEPHDGDLDLWEGEAGEDMEPSLGSPEIHTGGQYLYADERGNISVFYVRASQERWANGTPGASDMEEESVNEDGEEFGA